jgi:hypothetical protein
VDEAGRSIGGSFSKADYGKSRIARCLFLMRMPVMEIVAAGLAYVLIISVTLFHLRRAR